jgi:hypothetical protein
MPTDCPLRVRPAITDLLLKRTEFHGVPDQELIFRASVRLGLARLGAIQGIAVADRVTAIAVLVAMPDRTDCGLV